MLVYQSIIYILNSSMEKRKQKSMPQLEPSFDYDSLPLQINEGNALYQLIPKQIKLIYGEGGASSQVLYNCLINLHQHPKTDELKELFDEIGADLTIWTNKTTPEEKSQYLLNILEKNVQESLKKVSSQANTYINNVLNSKKADRKKIMTGKKKNDFDWLVLNTKNEMLKSKLKTKLVQTINQYKNQKRLREVMGRELDEDQKIHLEDESIELYQDQKSKLNYEWTADDEEMFLQNIKNLKEKFTQTQFLKHCHRFKFITDSELKTLASEEISRKLDKSNKAFLSRQFLLDKYFSTKETLTEKQMKFILKTSPLLSKCVDKAFVRAAIKNIKYEDIDKMQLQIAEEIIEKFEMIRNLVKKSRKTYKQRQNNKTKERIQTFERMKTYEERRLAMNEGLEKHKVKLIRNLTFRPQTAVPSSTKSQKNKQNMESIHFLEGKIPKKMVWPIPLNNHHPSTGLFIKDCSEQLSQEYNQYEKNYLKGVFASQTHQNKPKISMETQASMIKFYTGGPIDNNVSTRNTYLANQQSLKSDFHYNIINAVCEAFKTAQYRKQIQNKLNTIDLQSQQFEDLASDVKPSSIIKSVADLNFPQGKKGKKTMDQIAEDPKLISPTQKAIKDQIIEGRQKIKMNVFVKKLLALAAQNSFLSIKALNAKFTPSQINSLDSKGNTALFYATKHKNEDFIDYLLSLKADVNVKCSKGATPLHNAFKSSNYALICKCLSGAYPPNLNAIDDDGKTPLAYCCRKVLQMLGLQSGVVQVTTGSKLKFNNNSLLCKTQDSNCNESLEAKVDIRRTKNLIV